MTPEKPDQVGGLQKKSFAKAQVSKFIVQIAGNGKMQNGCPYGRIWEKTGRVLLNSH